MPSDRRGIAPRKQPRQSRAERTRERILDAAAHVFGEYGYAAGTTNRIAEQARVSIGSLYQYYPNKDAILAELLTRHLDAGRAAFEGRQRAKLPDSLQDMLRVFVRVTIDNHLDEPQLLRVMIEQAPWSAELTTRTEGYERERMAWTRELLDAHPEVQVSDIEVATRLVVTTAELVVHKIVASPDPVDLVRLEEELVAMLHRYLAGPA